MKKILWFLILLIPLTVDAEVNYKVTDYYVDANIDIAGSMNVKEIMVMDGTFNGNELELVYANSSLPMWKPGSVNLELSSIYNGSSIVNVKLGAMYINSKVDFNSFNNDFETLVEVNSADLGQKGVYVPYSIRDGLGFRMYYPANRGKVAFYAEYTITNVVVIHNDVAEIFWPFIDESFRDDIDNINIRLLLPSGDNTDNFRIWGHGSLTASITPLVDDNNLAIGILAQQTNFKAGSRLDVRMTFNKDIIEVQNFSKKSGIDALAKILEIEIKKADEANEQRQAIKVLYYGTVIFTITYFISLIVLWIYIYIKFDREHKSNFQSKYYREFIDDYEVEVIDYLFRKSISPNAMSASIMNLIYKKNITAEQLEGKKKDYRFTLQNKNYLSESESHLIEFLFDKVGNKNEFTTVDLHKYAGGTLTYSTFTSNYEKWKNRVIAEGKKQNFYESNGSIKIAGSLFAIVGIFISIFTFNKLIEFLPAQFMFIPSIIFLIYILSFSKRTKKGNDDYLKWSAFKRFLLDFSILPQRELPEIVIWERYMVYATILGVAKQVSKAMNVRIQEFGDTNTMHTPMFNTYLYMNMSSSVNRAVSSAVRESISKAAANSASSSGGGFGGGFSGGGGGGFGGGGRSGGGF